MADAALHSEVSTTPAPHGAVRRAAFDIGSGATKLMVGDVADGAIKQVLQEAEKPVGFAIDWQQSSDNCLSEAIQAKGLDVIKEFQQICARHGVPDGSRSAIATEVFRKAANGAAYLEKVHHECGLRVEVISQDIEAELGFKTAVALQEGPAENVVCWDSGGASFQITSLQSDLGTAGSRKLQSYVGSFGTGNTASLLVETVLGKSFVETVTPNPVTAEQALELVKLLQARIADPPKWLEGAHVQAIGGLNCMFKVTAEVLGRSKYDLADVKEAMQKVCGKTDQELAATPCCQGDLREPPSLIVPKVCLLTAVMEHCGMADVRFCDAIGSCPGMLIDDMRFQDGAT